MTRGVWRGPCSKEDLWWSLSDDSFGHSKEKSSVLETLGKPSRKELKKKDAVPWWIAEDDSDDGGKYCIMKRRCLSPISSLVVD
uniref:Uncharacterized protein n=1 Tax=Crocodylus porosus TaxID=8502 RepID=A0A7M4G223_CROPO